MKLDAKVPSGPMQNKWDSFKETARLVTPANKRKYTLLVVGTGLAGASAAASLAELGYNVKVFCLQDSARRAHSVAAQSCDLSVQGRAAICGAQPKSLQLVAISFAQGLRERLYRGDD